MADRKVEKAAAEFHAGCMVVPVTLTPAATVTLTKADNADRLNLIPSIATGGGADNYVLPTAERVGESYRLCWSGTAADADNIIIRSSAADGLTFSGGILSVDEDATNDAQDVNVVYPGNDDDKLTLTNPTSFDILFTATSTTNYHVTGYAASTDTHAAFGDQ